MGSGAGGGADGTAGSSGRADTGFCLAAAMARLATGFGLGLAEAGFLAATWLPAMASFASATASAFRASAKSAFACLACLRARRAMSFTSLRRRLAARACCLDVCHRLSAATTRRRAACTAPASFCESGFMFDVFIIIIRKLGGPVGQPLFLNHRVFCLPTTTEGAVKLDHGEQFTKPGLGQD